MNLNIRLHNISFDWNEKLYKVAICAIEAGISPRVEGEIPGYKTRLFSSFSASNAVFSESARRGNGLSFQENFIPFGGKSAFKLECHEGVFTLGTLKICFA